MPGSGDEERWCAPSPAHPLIQSPTHFFLGALGVLVVPRSEAYAENGSVYSFVMTSLLRVLTSTFAFAGEPGTK